MELLKEPKNVVIGVLVLVIAVGAYAVSKKDNHITLSEDATTTMEKKSEENTPDVVVNMPKSNDGTTADTRPVAGTPVKTAPATSPSVGKAAPELQLPSGFSNSDPFKLQDIVGKKVILLSFENYTSQNSLRTAPYLNQWHERYKNMGLSVITVHTPRFAFDRSKENVDDVAFAYHILHPIVLDNQFATANAWGSKEWPTHFLVDINGKIVNVYKGEGNYEAIEARVVQLLKERTAKLKLPSNTYPPFETPKNFVSVDLPLIKSPETFFGATRNNVLGNGTAHLMGIQDMKPIVAVVSNTPYLSGSWEFTGDFARSSIENNKIIYRYNAKNVYMVFGSPKMNKVRVSLDGAPLGARAGTDVREEKGQSYLYVSEERVYNIVKGDSYGEHTLEFVSETPGLEVYVLMFG